MMTVITINYTVLELIADRTEHNGNNTVSGI